MTINPDQTASVSNDRYKTLTALEKRDYLFEAGIRATAYADDALPDTHLGIVQFAESAVDSFTHHLLRSTLVRSGDELETPKHKLFHTYGTTAKIRFTPTIGTPYTGIFEDGAPGLARFSYAGPVAGIGIVPGLGLKFLIDGDRPSENAVMMRGLDPQLGISVFLHPFTNILNNPSIANLIMRGVKERFETVVTDGQGLHQPVDNLASIHVSGAAVDVEVRAPYRVILVPAPEAQQATTGLQDFRIKLARHIPSGMQIYTVLALDEQAEADLGGVALEGMIPHARQIGVLTTESEFVASAYGDYRLFFKHNATFLRPE